MSYHYTGSYSGHEFTRPLPMGATEPTTAAGKAKGWLYMLGIIGIAVVALKLTSKPKRRKKRKNPRKKLSERAAQRQLTLAANRSQAVEDSALRRLEAGEITGAQYDKEVWGAWDQFLKASDRAARSRPKRKVKLTGKSKAVAAARRAMTFKGSSAATKSFMRKHPIKKKSLKRKPRRK